jgi:hypothetical protein
MTIPMTIFHRTWKAGNSRVRNEFNPNTGYAPRSCGAAERLGFMLINSRAPTADHPLDSYMTPPEAVRALMAIERLPKSIADPCCGDGGLLQTLRAGDHIVFGADIVNYGWPFTVIRDFLVEPVEMNGVAIITNPPYRLAEAFIRKAISDGCHYHAWLLRLNFLESMRRKSFFESMPPSRVHVFSRRIPMTHRLNWEGPKASSNMTFAWFVWDGRPEVDNRPQLNFVDWRNPI